MAIDDIIFKQMIGAQDDQIDTFNPWMGAAQTATQINPYIPQAGGGTNFFSGLVQGAASGIFGGLAQQRQQEIAQAKQTSLMDLLTAQRQQEREQLAQEINLKNAGKTRTFDDGLNTITQELDAKGNWQQLGKAVNPAYLSKRAGTAEFDPFGDNTEQAQSQTIGQPSQISFNRTQPLGQSSVTPVVPGVQSSSGQPVNLPGDVAAAPQVNPQVDATGAAVNAPIRVQTATEQFVDDTPLSSPAAKAQRLKTQLQPLVKTGIAGDPVTFRQFTTDLDKKDNEELAGIDALKRFGNISNTLEEGINLAGQTGQGAITTAANALDAGAAFLGIGGEEPRKKLLGNQKINQAGSEVASLKAETIPSFSKLADTDPGARLFINPIKPGSDQLPETNKAFLDQINQAVVEKAQKSAQYFGVPVEKIRKDAGLVGPKWDALFNPQGDPNQTIEAAVSGQGQPSPTPQDLQDPQAQAVTALNLGGGTTPPAGGGGALIPQSKKEVPFEAIAQTLPKETREYVGKVFDASGGALPAKLDSANDDILNAVARVESGGNPNAVSKVGAKGMYQFMDATGKEQLAKLKKAGAVPADAEYDPFNPQQQKLIAGNYVNELLQRYNGDVKLALAAYNGGMGTVEKKQGSVWESIKKGFEGAARKSKDRSEFSKYVQNLADQAGQGATFNTSDEALSALSSLFGKDYKESLATQRANIKQFAEANPKAALAANIAGSIAPFIASGGGTALAQGAGKAALQTAKIGAAQGAAAGFGAGEDGLYNRAQGGLVGAILGGGLGGGASLAGSGIAAGAKAAAPLISQGAQKGSQVADYLAQRLSRSGRQTGAIGDIGGEQVAQAAQQAADPATVNYMARFLNKLGYTTDDIAKAADEIAVAKAEGSPLSLADTLLTTTTPEGDLILKSGDLATRLKTLTGGTNDAAMRLSERKAATRQAVKGAVNELAPTPGTSYGDSKAFAKGVISKKAAIEEARALEASPLYEQAAKEQRKALSSVSLGDATPEIKKAVAEIEDLVTRDKNIQSAIKSVRSTSSRDLVDKSDTDFDVLNRAYGQLKVKADSLISGKTKAPNKAAREQVLKSRDELSKAMEVLAPSYKEARRVFAEGSTPLDDAMLQSVAKTATKDPMAAAKKLLDAPPEDVLAFKDVLGPEKLESFRKGVRSALKDTLDDKGDKVLSLGDSIFRTPNQKDNLKALLGADDYAKLERKLIRERRIAATNTISDPGSRTASILADQDKAAADEAGSLVEILGQALQGNQGNAISKAAGFIAKPIKNRFSRTTPELDNSIVNVLLNQQSSEDILPALIQALQTRETISKTAAKASKYATRPGSQTLSKEQVEVRRGKKK